MPHPDSFACRRQLEVDGRTYHYSSLPEAARQLGDLRQLPISLKVLLENLLRFFSHSTTARQSAALTLRPSSLRSRFSSSTLSEMGSWRRSPS